MKQSCHKYLQYLVKMYIVTNPWSTYDVTKVNVHPIIAVDKMAIVCLAILQFNQLSANALSHTWYSLISSSILWLSTTERWLHLCYVMQISRNCHICSRVSPNWPKSGDTIWFYMHHHTGQTDVTKPASWYIILLQQPARGGQYDALEMPATEAEWLRQLVLCS